MVLRILQDLPGRFRNTLLGYPPLGKDLVGYWSLLAWLKENQIAKLNSDIVEIDSFGDGALQD
jgi:hypothetical protein